MTKIDSRVLETQLRKNNSAGRMCDYIKASDVAKITGLSLRSVQRAVRDGGVSTIGVGRATRYYLPHVAQALAR